MATATAADPGAVRSREWTRRALAIAGPPALYFAIALIYWFTPIAGSPRTSLIANDDIDASAFMWFFQWWPHALAHGLNPFVPDVIFAPEGYNLAWASSMPGPSLLLVPVTALLGPVVAWNLLALLAPALSAWTAYLLCRHVTGRVGPSLIGGYVFGFSPYMLYHITGAPNLALMALVPLGVLLVLRFVDGSLRPVPFVAGMTAVVAGQFVSWIETAAVATMFAAIALLIAYALFPERRRTLRRTVLLLAVAYGLAVVVTSPFFYAFLFEPHADATQALKPYSIDLFGWVVPGQLQAIATDHTGADLPSYAGGFAYVGVPLVVLLGLFAWRYRARRSARLLVLFTLAAALFTMGRKLRIGGHDTGFPLPSEILAHLPAFKYAIPPRFSAYVFLALALIVALWLSWARGKAAWALVLAALVLFLPDVGNHAWKSTPISAPAFFENGNWRTQLRHGDRVIAVPPWRESMRWQASEGYPFELVGGYLGAFPKDYLSYPTFTTLLNGKLSPGYGPQLRRFVRDKGATAIVVDEREPGPWRKLFGTLGVEPVRAQGVLVYRLTPGPAGAEARVR